MERGPLCPQKVWLDPLGSEGPLKVLRKGHLRKVLRSEMICLDFRKLALAVNSRLGNIDDNADMFQWVHGWLGEQMVADPRSGMLLSNKKGRTTDTQNNMDEVQIYYASERSQTRKVTVSFM